MSVLFYAVKTRDLARKPRQKFIYRRRLEPNLLLPIGHRSRSGDKLDKNFAHPRVFVSPNFFSLFRTVLEILSNQQTNRKPTLFHLVSGFRYNASAISIYKTRGWTGNGNFRIGVQSHRSNFPWTTGSAQLEAPLRFRHIDFGPPG